MNLNIILQHKWLAHLILFITLLAYSNFSKAQINFIQIDTIDTKRDIPSNKYSDAIFIFYDMECPISKSYINSFDELILHFSNNRNFFLVLTPFSDLDKVDGILEKTSKFEAILFDKDLLLAKKLKLSTLPSVAVLRSKKKILYRGAIDNKYLQLGVPNRNIKKENYLINALKSIESNKRPKVRYVEPVGCRFR